MEQGLTVRPKTLKLLQKAIEKTFEGIGTNFLNGIPIAQEIRGRTENVIASN
jgi:hypothetical protein